jgi:hypothetical protein
MRGTQRSTVSRASGLIALLLALTVAAVAGACGERTAASPPRATPPSSPSASAAGDSWVRVQSGNASAFSRSTDRLALSFREYRRSGSWRVSDLTDGTAALTKVAGEHEQLWVMDLSDGRTRRVLAGATDPEPGFWIGTVRLSDQWLVWEEVGSGDDLMGSVDWRLYAAPLQRASLTLGRPVLIASAATNEATRPLFDVSGSRLAWVGTAWTGPGAVARSQLVVADLASGRRRVVYRARGVLDTVNLSGDQAIVGETPRRDASNTRFAVLDLSTGEHAEGFDVASAHALSHWPAWRDGWLAWAPFQTADATYPFLYLRDPSGAVFTEGGLAVDPCFVGPYLFYQARRQGRPYEGDTVEVRALRLRDLTSFVLESGKPDEGTAWRGTVGAPEVQHTYITSLDRASVAEKDSDRYTIIRVYRVE